MEEVAKIVIQVRSFIEPDGDLEGFRIGEAMPMEVPPGLTLEEFIGMTFSRQADKIGILALNGKLASEKTRIAPGDMIDLYPYLDGG